MTQPQPIVVTHEGGARFAAQIRSHRVVVDQPADAGGNEAGPMPLELFVSTLGMCVAYYVHRYLASRALPHEGLRVEVGFSTARNPYRVSEYSVRVVLPEALGAHDAEMVERAARSCPVHGTLMNPPEIRVAVEVGAGV